MKKEYLFLILIWIILYLMYLIFDYKYKEYKINMHSELLSLWNEKERNIISNNKEIISYITTNAYKDKVSKEELSRKNKWEEVIVITHEDKYNTFTSNNENISKEWDKNQKPTQIYDTMTISEKWFYFLFQKDIR